MNSIILCVTASREVRSSDKAEQSSFAVWVLSMIAIESKSCFFVASKGERK